MNEVIKTIERLEEKFLFFAVILNKQNVIESCKIHSAGTNGRSLVVNPVFF